MMHGFSTIFEFTSSFGRFCASDGGVVDEGCEILDELGLEEGLYESSRAVTQVDGLPRVPSAFVGSIPFPGRIS